MGGALRGRAGYCAAGVCVLRASRDLARMTFIDSTTGPRIIRAAGFNHFTASAISYGYCACQARAAGPARGIRPAPRKEHR
jgi:hypothetical protein